MSGEDASRAHLQELSAILTEFYSTADAGRQREIDGLLAEFKAHPESWRHAQYFLASVGLLQTEQSGQYVLFYATLIFEEFVRRFWTEADEGSKAEIRGFLLQFLTSEAGASLPPFVFTKLAKVNVDVAKRDWPASYPAFMETVLAGLAGDEAGRSVGLALLRLTAEEFVSDRAADVPADRKAELKLLLSAQLPSILGLLFGLLDTGVQGGCSPATCQAGLETLQQLFSWVPLSEHVTPARLQTLCKYTVTHAADALGLLALGCLNELLSKNYVPLEFGDFLRVCFEHIGTLLELVAAHSADQTYVSDHDEESFADKVVQFTLAFFTNHLSRVEGADGFDTPRLLGLLYAVTYGRPGLSSRELLRGAECWDYFAEYVLEHKQDTALVASYGAGLLAVLDAAVPTLLFEKNGDMLAELLEEEPELAGMGADDAEALWGTGEDGEEAVAETPSELAEFTAAGIELVGKIVELYPQAGVERAFAQWTASWETFAAAHAAGGSPDTLCGLARDVGLLLQVPPQTKPHQQSTSGQFGTKSLILAPLSLISCGAGCATSSSQDSMSQSGRLLEPRQSIPS